MTDAKLNSTLDVAASIFGRCFLLSMGAMLFSWSISLIAGDQIHQIFTNFVDMTRREFDIFLTWAYTFMKVLNFVLFLVPWAGIRLYLRSQRQTAV